MSAVSDEIVRARLAEPLRDVGTRAIGFVGCDLPLEVFSASGRWFGHLPWRSEGATPWADCWLESSFPFWARSILEQWHDAAFDSIETVFFSRSDDASQRLYYYIRELQRRGLLAGPRAEVFDIALIGRESSLAHTVASIAALADELEVDRENVSAGIERMNSLRHRMSEIHRARVVDGPFYERLMRAALWSDAARWIDDVQLPRVAARATKRPRVLLSGSFPPDDRIHRLVEDSDASVIAEISAHSFAQHGAGLVETHGEPFEAIARALVENSAGPRSMRQRAADIVERAADVRADAVVIWLTREDEALAWHLPGQVRALAGAGIRTLALPAANWAADDAVAARIAEFLEECLNATT